MIPAFLQHNKEKIPVNIPTSWNDVKFVQFHAINLLGDKPDIFDIYAILLGIHADKIRNISISSFEMLAAKMNFLADKSVFESVKTDYDIVIDGVHYKYAKDLGTESIACYKDWEQDIQKGLDESDPFKMVELTLAYFLRPEGEDYSYSNVEARTKLFMNISCVQAIHLYRFFLQRSYELKNDSKLLIWKLTMKKSLLVWSKSLGMVFTVPFTAWLWGTFSILRLSLKKAYMRFMRSYNTNRS